MNKMLLQATGIVVIGLVLPELIQAQSGGVAGEIHGLQAELDTVYDQMIPLCSKLTGVGRALAGFAATWYIASRVWRHIAEAEPVDVYPLLRPFVIGFAALIFPSVVSLANAVLEPIVYATNKMVVDSDQAIDLLLKQKEAAVQNSDFYKMYVGPDGSGDRDKWYQYTHPDDPNDANEGVFSTIGNDIKFAMAKMSYNFRNSIKQFLSDVLQIFYEAASLCINTIRTFYLLILAIIGPIAFGLSVFDGLHHTLMAWVAKYINIFLWLPVANIFGSVIGKIQQNMIQLDINQIVANGDTFFSSTDTAYLIFLIIGIIGYFTVPSVANHIINAGDGNMLLSKTTNSFNSTVSGATSTAVNTSVAAARMSGKMFSKIFSKGDGGSGDRRSFGGSGESGAGQNSHLAQRLSGESDSTPK